MGLSMKERKPTIRESAVRYRAARTKAGKSRILTGFTIATGFNRKYATGILGSEGRTRLLRLDGKLVKTCITHKTGKKRAYEKRYGLDVAACIIRLGEFFRDMCGKRLVPLIRTNISTLATSLRKSGGSWFR
jgi:hypothetical protein